jgi:hypothetical protein
VLVSATTVCRPAAGACDVAESCTGSSASCPTDLKSTAVCRPAAGPCDVAESCDGTSNGCPANAFSPSTTECRAAAGVCDLAESCTGSGAACPADTKRTDVCRASAGACDVADSCDGTSNNCPADALQPSTLVCRPAAGACDVPERCTGSAATCPADVFRPSTDVCRPAESGCDIAESCSGSGPACPADSGEPDEDDDGVCNLRDNDDGIGDDCDPCNNIVPVFAIKQRVRIKRLNTPAGDDRLRFKGIITVPTSPPIDPTTKGVRVLIDDGDGNRVLDAIIPGGAEWKANQARTRWRYRNSHGPLGITKVRIRGRRKLPGRLKFVVVGKRGNYVMSPTHTPLKGTFIVDSPMARTGQCGEALFTGPSRRCIFNSTGSTLNCK